jgi:hypothetical protein
MSAMGDQTHAERDIDTLLHEAGAQWRTQQVFGDVRVSRPAVRGRAFGRLVIGTLGIVVVGAVALGLATFAPRALENAGATGSPTPTDTPVATTAPVASLSPAALEAAQLPVIEAVNADRVNFGGVFIDNDGTLVIQYYGANAGAAAVEPLIVPGLPVRWEQVTRTREELDRIHAEIVASWPNGVGGIGLDTIKNQVVVTVFDAAILSEITHELARYGDAVRIECCYEISFPSWPMRSP